MTLRKFASYYIAVIASLSMAVLFISIYSVKYNANKNQKQLEKMYLETTFQIYKEDIIGGLLIDDRKVLQAVLDEVSKKRLVNIVIQTDKWTLISYGSIINASTKFPIFNSDSKLADVYISLKNEVVDSSAITDYWVFLLLQLIILLLGFIYLIRVANHKIVSPLSKLVHSINSNSVENVECKKTHIFEINEVISAMKTLTQKLILQAQYEAHIQLSRQVSHDIRSPLSALNMSLYGLSSMPEDRRILIRNAVQRINDIANDLLEKSKSSKLGLTTIVTSSIEQMSPLIDSLVSEKRIQFRDKSNIEISVDLEKSYGLFAKVNANEFKRVLSNAINNSVEAANVGKKTIISVAVFLDNNSVVIQITDNGKGIPLHILSKLGKQEVSSGKKEIGSGSGLGVMHAKKTIESFGGDFKIESQLDVGATIKIFLPLAETPDWFVKKLFLERGLNFITFDDDISIHQIWSGRLSSLQSDKNDITHFSFSNSKDFKEKVPNLLKQKCILLVDYEIISEKNNGLDFVEQIAEQDKSILKSTILVTSRYDENPIKERCQRLGIKMIPKAMAGYVPIEIVDSKQRFDAILLDDDLLVHECWKMYATENNKVIKLFTNFEEFMSFLPSVDFQTKIFVDSNLGPNSSMKGEQVLYKLNSIGYNNLYLCTGYDSDQFQNIQHIRAVVGKEPSF